MKSLNMASAIAKAYFEQGNGEWALMLVLGRAGVRSPSQVTRYIRLEQFREAISALEPDPGSLLGNEGQGQP